MFGLFKKKTEKEKLISKYKNLKKIAYKQYKINRRKSGKARKNYRNYLR